MEVADRELIAKVIEQDATIKRLFKKHELLEKELLTYESRQYLTSQEEVLVKKLKEKKLRGKEELMERLADYRTGQDLVM